MKPKPTAKILRGTPRNLNRLAKRLREGEIVAVPTETVYGLAANALDAGACRKIFRAKGRPLADPLIVHVYALKDLAEICVVNPAVERVAREFWPGPLTMVLPKKAAVPDVVTAGRSSVAVRMPSDPLFRRLIRLAGVPLAAPSANPFGYVSPTTAEHVREGLGEKIGYILDGGAARIGVESTIIDLRDPARPRMLRPGAISAEALMRVLGCRIGRPVRRTGVGSAPIGELAPGLLPRHYSPRTPLVVHARPPRAAGSQEALLFLGRPPGKLAPNVFWLDPDGELRGAARRLYATLRRLDAMHFQKIHVELAPPVGLGLAINDRLRRAAAAPTRQERGRPPGS